MSGTGDLISVPMGTIGASAQTDGVRREVDWNGTTAVRISSTGAGSTSVQISDDGTTWYQYQKPDNTGAMVNIAKAGAGDGEICVDVPWKYIRGASFSAVTSATFTLVQRKGRA